MLAVVLAVAAAVSFSASDYAAGLAARGSSAVRVTVVAQVTSAVLLLPVIPFLSAGPLPSLASLAWGAAAGASGVAGAAALYLGFRHAAFSVASSVSAVGAAAFSVLAGLLFGERPGTLSLAGIALALPAIAAVSVPAAQPGPGQLSPGPVGPGEPGPGQLSPGLLSPSAAGPGAASPAAGEASGPAGRPGRQATGRHAAGVLWGLIAGAGFGFFFIGLNRAGSASDLWPLAAAEVAGVATAVGMAVGSRQLAFPPAGTRWLSVLTGVTAVAGTLSYFLATHHGLLAVTAVTTSLYPAGTILLARFLLGERLTGVRITGLCLAAASVSLIAAAGSA